MVQYLPSVKAPKMFLLPASSLLSCHQNNLNIKLKPKFLREGRRGIWPQQLGLWCASPFFAPNSLPNINILPILNKYLSHEREEMCWTLLANIGGVASHQIPMLTLLLICCCLERRSPPQPPKRRSPPQQPTASKVTMGKSTSPPPCSKFGGQKNKKGVNLGTAQLCYLIHCVLKN